MPVPRAIAEVAVKQFVEALVPSACLLISATLYRFNPSTKQLCGDGEPVIVFAQCNDSQTNTPSLSSSCWWLSPSLSFWPASFFLLSKECSSRRDEHRQKTISPKSSPR